MDFVWIYAKEFSYFNKFGIWNELEYSIKSVRKYYPDAVCWVVGDDPGLDVKHIYVDRIKYHKSKLEQDIDVIKKFKTIIDSDIGDEFVLMYDDIYLLKPVTYNDLKITWGRCLVEDIDTYTRPWSRKYRGLWQNTYKIIKEFREDIYDWETHLPRLLKKDLLDQVIYTYSCDEIPLIATSLYAAHFAERTEILTEKIQLNLLNTQIDLNFDYMYMNIMDETITLSFKNKMMEVFGEGTSFKPAYRRH